MHVEDDFEFFFTSFLYLHAKNYHAKFQVVLSCFDDFKEKFLFGNRIFHRKTVAVYQSPGGKPKGGHNAPPEIKSIPAKFN